jgi:hypothetical protein
MHLACFFTYVSCRILFTINIIYFFAQLPEANLVILSSLVVQTKADNIIKKTPNDVSTVTEVPDTEDSTKTTNEVVKTTDEVVKTTDEVVKTTGEVVNNVVDTAVGYSWTQIALIGLGVTVAVVAVVSLVYYFGLPDKFIITPEMISKGNEISDIVYNLLDKVHEGLKFIKVGPNHDVLIQALINIENIVLEQNAELMVKIMATPEFTYGLLALLDFVKNNSVPLNIPYDPTLEPHLLALCTELYKALGGTLPL